MQTQNDPIQSYLPGSPERHALEQALAVYEKTPTKILAHVGGKSVDLGDTQSVVEPHAHGRVLAKFGHAHVETLQSAIRTSDRVHTDWSNTAPEYRIAIFKRAAALITTQYRYALNATTMLGQSKNPFQAEIDSACELIDFLNFNCEFYESILAEQPLSITGVINQTDWRPLEGHVAAITPFNFTAIAGNLPALPALLGNTVLWKPSDTQLLSAQLIHQIFLEAGLPPEVIQFIPADGPTFSREVIAHPHFEGLSFTGSTNTLQNLWNQINANLPRYRALPRIVAETGGKDFIFAHPSADPEALKVALLRGAFEYQGQKCSAASRAYLPRSLWTSLKKLLVEATENLHMGDVRDFSTFLNAVIDARAFARLEKVLTEAKADPELTVLAGGTCSKEIGYFVRPTLIETKNPNHSYMQTEFFGPILTIYVYEDADWQTTLRTCDQGSPYALTGAFFAQSEPAIIEATKILRYSAGNFYINDKPTGAVVAQQPFGGSRKSGTNDKAGSRNALYRFLSPRTIKRNLHPPTELYYPYMGLNR